MEVKEVMREGRVDLVWREREWELFVLLGVVVA